jgi:hypothetical protein
MDTVNAKINKFLTESHEMTILAKERASFLKINDITDISCFGTPDLQISNKYESLTMNKFLMKSVTTLK